MGEEFARIRLSVERPAGAVVRVRWWAGGRLVGDRRLYTAQTILPAPGGPVTVEVEDVRGPHDPDRLAAARTTIEARAGWRTDLAVRLERGAIVSGRVRAADGPARFAEVEALLPDGRRVRTRADGRGEYLLGGLPSGLVRVAATRRGLTSPQQPVHAEAGRARWAPLETVLPVVPAPVRAAPAALGGALRGSVVDAADRTPLHRATVVVRDARGTVLARGRTDRDGTFVVGADLPTTGGLTLEVRTGPDRVVVDRLVRRGLGVRAGQVTDAGELAVRRSEAPVVEAVRTRPRPAAAMRLPALRV